MDSRFRQLLILIECIVSVSLVQALPPPTTTKEAELSDQCKSLITKSQANLPGFVRLAFHDCVGPNGCDGCFDDNNADNAGLKFYADQLEEIYDLPEVSDYVTRADFWILCSFVAIKEGHRNAANQDTAPNLLMKYGRQHCNADSPYQPADSDAYPSPHGTYNDTTGYFNREFGLTDDETVALLGAHTLGRAKRENSGFTDKWVDGEFKLDNEFYVDMISETIDWVQRGHESNTADPHYQWVHNDTQAFLMFTSDMCLTRDVQPTSNGRVEEDFNDISYSPGHQLTELYAQDNQKWLEDFAIAYTKMIEKKSPGSETNLVPAKEDPGASVSPTKSSLSTTTQLPAPKVPTKSQEAELSDRCRRLITASQANLPGFVRLAFHDCVGPNGCDGCFDNNNPDNGGLRVYADNLESVYDDPKVSDVITRADFWVLCSFIAIEEGHKNSERDLTSLPPLVMRYGRQHCDADNPYHVAEADAYPSPHGNYSTTTNYFSDQFGLSANETVALLGAHTLGRAKRENSGFIDKWVDGEFKLDNEFYVDIIHKSWVQKNDSDYDAEGKPHWQWVRNETHDFLMFSSDVCLSKDVQPDFDGRVTEELDELPYSEGHSLTQIYANNNARWLGDFAVAYTKMIEKKPPGSLDVLLSSRNDPASQSTQKPSKGSTASVMSSTNAGSSYYLSLSLAVLLTTTLAVLFY